MKLQKLLDEYKYNKKNQETIKKEIIRVVPKFFDIDAYTLKSVCMMDATHRLYLSKSLSDLKLTIVFKMNQ